MDDRYKSTQKKFFEMNADAETAVLRMFKYGVKLIHYTGDRLLWDGYGFIDRHANRDPKIFPMCNKNATKCFKQIYHAIDEMSNTFATSNFKKYYSMAEEP